MIQSHFQIWFQNQNITQKYYLFLQKNKATGKAWRYNKTKQQLSLGTNSQHIIFNCIEDN